MLGACGVYYSWSERIGDGRRLPSSNSVELRITSGDVTVVGSTGSDFRVSFDGHPAGSAKDAPVSIDRNRQPVLIEISKLPQGVRALVEIPERSHLAVRMGAGELSIHGMRGDLYAVLRAGKLLIDVGGRSDYHTARGSVLAGALHAPAFSADKGGMFRFVGSQGSGQLELDAHVTSGELVLQDRSGSAGQRRPSTLALAADRD